MLGMMKIVIWLVFWNIILDSAREASNAQRCEFIEMRNASQILGDLIRKINSVFTNASSLPCGPGPTGK